MTLQAISSFLDLWEFLYWLQTNAQMIIHKIPINRFIIQMALTRIVLIWPFSPGILIGWPNSPETDSCLYERYVWVQPSVTTHSPRGFAQAGSGGGRDLSGGQTCAFSKLREDDLSHLSNGWRCKSKFWKYTKDCSFCFARQACSSQPLFWKYSELPFIRLREGLWNSVQTSKLKILERNWEGGRKQWGLCLTHVHTFVFLKKQEVVQRSKKTQWLILPTPMGSLEQK